jgi:anti-sigma factor RsiW
MDTIQDNEQRLWAYIDGLCTAEEKSTIEKLIQENMEWRSLYHELLQVHQALTGAELEQPSLAVYKERDGRNCTAPDCTGYKSLH